MRLVRAVMVIGIANRWNRVRSNREQIAAMTDVSLLRLYVMRATYLLLVVGLGLMIWPQIIHHPMSTHGATTSLLAAVQLLAIVGLRYPLQMLPVLLFELVWKSIWLTAI